MQWSLGAADRDLWMILLLCCRSIIYNILNCSGMSNQIFAKLMNQFAKLMNQSA